VVKVVSTEKVEIKVQLDKKVHNALTFYVGVNDTWISNEHKDEAISGYVAHIVEEWMKMEARNPQDAVECITRELCLLLDLEAEAP
jgi:hypothetical protein